MASPLQPEFDGVNLIITLPSGVSEIQVENNLYSQWKEWTKIGDNGKYPPAFRTTGGDPLTPGIDAGAYFFIQNQDGWRIRPAEEDATVLLIGNLAPEDSTVDIAIPTIGAFTVLLLGLQPITQNVETILEQTQEALYQGAVHINTFTGVPGTEFPIGTASDPVNNLADAITISTTLGFTRVVLTGVVTLTQAFNFWNFEGSSGLAVVNTNGQDVGGSIFRGIGITGAITLSSPASPVVLVGCQVLSTGLFGFMGNIAQTVFDGDLTLGEGDTTIFDSASNISGIFTPTIDRNSVGGNLSVRGWLGGLEITNFDQGASCSVDLQSGHVILGPTVTNGAFVIRGVGKFTDNTSQSPATAGSPALIIDKEGLIDGRDITLIKQLTGGNATVSLDDLTVTIFDEDGVTTLATYDISSDGRIRTRTS
jgi:hypothetical protein